METLGLRGIDCLDALVHVGGGTIGALDRIAAQAEGSSLFVDQFLRTLEGLGHIDVRRDDRLQPVEWEANPSFVAETSQGSFVLAGVWSESLRNRIGVTVGAAGGALRRESSENALSIWTIEKITRDQLASAITATELDVYVVDRAVDRMLDALPPLSAVEASLATHPIPDYSKASIFDLGQASWVPVPGVAIPGAYRLEQSFRSTTIWVSGQGAVDRTARVGTVHLVKHLAARASKQPLLGYDESTQALSVPMGADLPGLYGRAAMLCSGRPPKLSRSTRSLVYLDVPREVADRLNSLLAG